MNLDAEPTFSIKPDLQKAIREAAGRVWRPCRGVEDREDNGIDTVSLAAIAAVTAITASNYQQNTLKLSHNSLGAAGAPLLNFPQARTNVVFFSVIGRFVVFRVNSKNLMGQ